LRPIRSELVGRNLGRHVGPAHLSLPAAEMPPGRSGRGGAMDRAVRLAIVGLLGGVMFAALPLTGVARATGSDCSDVGHRVQGATLDAWFTPDETDTSTA